jgi:hypothetical protein
VRIELLLDSLRASLVITIVLLAFDAHADAIDDARTLPFGAYADTAQAFERVAADVALDANQRAEAATAAAWWRSLLDDRERTIADIALARRLRPSWSYLAVADRWPCDIDFRRWRRLQANADVAVASCVSVFSAYQRGNKEDELVTQLEASWRIAQIKTVTKALDHRDWLKTTVRVWAALDAVGAGSPIPFSRMQQRADHAAQAEYVLVSEDAEAAFPEPSSACRFLTHDADVAKVDALDKKLLHIINTYPSDEWVVTAEARRAMLRDALRTSLYWCAGSQMWWTRNTALFRAKSQSLATSQTPPPLATTAWTAFAQAKLQRDAWIDVADERAVQLYAHALDEAQRTDVRNPTLQHAARTLLALVERAGLAHLKTLTGLVNFDRMLVIANAYARLDLQSDEVLVVPPAPLSP